MSTQLFDLSGRVALITGGSKGLGKSMAKGFAQAGADVLITARTEGELQATQAELRELCPERKVEYHVADMRKRPEVEALAKSAIEKMGKVDILVNNAGTNRPQAIDEISDEDWDDVLEINLSSIMVLTRALVPGMRERKWGRIIHISSIMAITSKEKRNNYSATKAALMGFARASALDVGHDGITVNCIAPGPFLTDLPASVLSDAEQKVFSDHTAIGRWGRPDELIGPALLMASEAGSYITGETLVVDGGFLCR